MCWTKRVQKQQSTKNLIFAFVNPLSMNTVVAMSHLIRLLSFTEFGQTYSKIVAYMQLKNTILWYCSIKAM